MQSIRDTVNDIAAGKSSALALIEQAQERAQANSHLNPIAYVDWGHARQQARERDQAVRLGLPCAALHGIAVSVKDLYLVDGMPTRGGTAAALPGLGEHEGSAVGRLRAAGAVLFAKTNMHEIALGATGENAFTGDVCNPLRPLHQAGGSSSGAAVCVATGIGLAGLGSDTGGSIRIPAAFCGVTGFKPSLGAIPLDGALALSWTCDHAGPLARSVADCALLYEVMAQRRAGHGRIARHPRLGVPAAWLHGRLHPQVREAFEGTLAVLRAAGAEVVEVDAPLLASAWSNYTPLVRAEAAWVHRAALAAGGAGFSEAVLVPLRAGEKISAAEYIAALQGRGALTAQLGQVLSGIDALVLPTSPVPAPLRGQTEVALEGGTMSVREAVLGQTLPFSFCGLPALSLPFGAIDGLPLGLQVVGRADGDPALLALGSWLEQRISAGKGEAG
ncbi:MAG: amidase [Burkholderiaceae bacterium]|nr:amidase [Burkholderiaceae bacterium]